MVQVWHFSATSVLRAVYRYGVWPEGRNSLAIQANSSLRRMGVLGGEAKLAVQSSSWCLYKDKFAKQVQREGGAIVYFVIFVTHFVVFVLLLYISVAVFRRARAESSVFLEYQQSRAALGLVFLLPVAPVIINVLPYYTGWLPAAVIATACCVPVMPLAWKQGKHFEVSGTDKTSKAEEAGNLAVTGSLVGLIYVVVWVALTATVSAMQEI